MKYFIIVLALIINSLIYINNSQSQWVQIPYGIGNTNSIECLTSKGNIIYAGAANSIFFSTNYGDWWIQSNANNRVLSLAYNDNFIFAGTYGEGVYVSTNEGITFDLTSLTSRDVYCLTVSDGNVFAGTRFWGVYITTNNGLNWAQTSLNNKYIRSLTSNGNKVFAGTSSYGVYTTTNNGLNWTQSGLSGEYVTAISTIGNNIIAGTVLTGIHISTDNGLNWTQTSLNNWDILSIAVKDSIILAGCHNNVFYSSNFGLTWSTRNEGLGTIFQVNSMLILNNYAYGGTIGKSIWKRPLSGLTGIKITNQKTLSSYSLSQNYPNPFNPTTKIKFDVVKSGNVKIVVYDVTGREVQTLVNKKFQPGTYETTFDGSGLTSGVYFYRMVIRQSGSSTDGYSETKKMIYLK